MSYGNYPDLSLVKRALVIKLRHHGDVLLTSPLFTELKRAIPQAEIDAFIYKETLPMLEGHPMVNNYLIYDKEWKKQGFVRRYFHEIVLLKKIRSNRYDLVINLTEGDRGAIAARLSGAKYRVGYGKPGVFTHLVKSCPHPRHTVERQLDVLRRIGIIPEEKELFLHIPESCVQKVEAELPPGYILIHPVSRWKFKCLAPKQMAEMIRVLHEKQWPIAISASPDASEMAMVDQILSLVPHIPVYNLAGSLSLKELAALIQSAKALITVDSVSLHIASATKTPVVALFGPTSEINWGPWMHPKARVVTTPFSCRPCYQDGCGGSKRSECLLSIRTDQIISALEEIIV